MNDQFIRYVGYQQSNSISDLFFSPHTVQFISKNVTNLLNDLHPNGIFVPDHRILEVMNSIYISFRPSVGDIFTHYNILSNENPNPLNEMINQVIQVITSNVRNNIETEMNNSKLDNWVVLQGDFNKWGLRQHAPINIRNKMPKTCLFNMNY